MEKREVKFVDTVDAYNQWAEIYDTDDNFLQALDSLEMKTLLPTFLSLTRSSSQLKYVDLGCGTGRNTLPLAEQAADAAIVGLDLSEGMLEVARRRTQDTHNVSLETYDMLSPSGPPASALEADGIVSTLALEHVPLGSFFAAVVSMLKPDGVLLVTNMHDEMGAVSQAGFTDPETGVKVSGTSYAHTAAEVVEAARAHGLGLIGGMKEATVDGDSVKLLGPRAPKWMGIKVWYGGLFRLDIGS